MQYADFVTDMYECLKEYSCCSTFSLAVFSEGPESLKDSLSSSQEYAILRNKYAHDFYDVIDKNPQLYAPKVNFCKLEESRILPGEVKITHSCYSKNIRRWIKGTLSRKQKCRAELCTLIWCWYEYWIEEICPHVDKNALGQSLLAICHKYSDYGKSFSMDVLWHGCEFAYRKSLEKI